MYWEFDDSLIGKTILFNVAAVDENGGKTVSIDNIGGTHDPWGGGDTRTGNGKTFRPAMYASILWNFHEATEVTLGPGSGFQFPGSILIPEGNLNMFLPGHNGRLIVGGNVNHYRQGSEFHNYKFNPPVPLPLPPDLECPPISIDLGIFSGAEIEAPRGGNVAGVTWNMEKRAVVGIERSKCYPATGGSVWNTEIHHLALTLQPQVYSSGKFAFGFEARTNKQRDITSAGIDNVKLISIKPKNSDGSCEAGRTPKGHAGTQDSAGTGTKGGFTETGGGSAEIGTTGDSTGTEIGGGSTGTETGTEGGSTGTETGTETGGDSTGTETGIETGGGSTESKTGTETGGGSTGIKTGGGSAGTNFQAFDTTRDDTDTHNDDMCDC